MACPTSPAPLLVAARQLHVDAQIAVEVRLRAVEVEVADGDAAQVPADARVDGLADDAVHAGEGADVDDPGGLVAGRRIAESDIIMA